MEENVKKKSEQELHQAAKLLTCLSPEVELKCLDLKMTDTRQAGGELAGFI